MLQPGVLHVLFAVTASTVSCPRAVSLYALQKSGVSFLARFSHDVAVRLKMCHIFQLVKEHKCEATIQVDCPRTQHHRKTVNLQRSFAPLPRGSACDKTYQRQMLDQGNRWLRSTEVNVHYRYNRSMAWLLSPHGFLRGPVRQLYLEYATVSVPAYPGFDHRIIVHTRHPVEMMVAAHSCFANVSICPIRCMKRAAERLAPRPPLPSL